MLAPDNTHVFVDRRRAAGRREEHDRAELRDRDRLHRRHPGPHQRRRHPGSPAAGDPQPRDRQDRVGRRELRAAGGRGHQAGRRQCRRTQRGRPSRRRPAAQPSARTPRKADRDIRWTMPAISDDGRVAVASARSADNKDRWLVTVDPETRQDARSSTCCTTMRGCGRAAGPAARRVQFVPRHAPRVVPVRARRLDASLHARRRPTPTRSRSS